MVKLQFPDINKLFSGKKKPQVMKDPQLVKINLGVDRRRPCGRRHGAPLSGAGHLWGCGAHWNGYRPSQHLDVVLRSTRHPL